MKYISTKEAAEKWGICRRRIQVLCANDRIPGARWELFEDSKHIAYVEQNEKTINLLIEWLNKYD